MTDEFVDFYEILELPVEAERAEIRKRISELYVEAQKNLDHRNFDTRVRNQQLFEMTLPQARYILLNDGRRDDYDRLVKASRAPFAETPVAPTQSAATTQSAELGQNAAPATSRFGSTEAVGKAPSIDALPDEASDPATIERERAEMWDKWKSGLQSAMEREAAKEGRSARDSGATTPLADRIEAVASGAPQPQSAPVASPLASDEAARSKSKSRPERPKVKFDFGGGGNAASAASANNAPQRGERAPVAGAEESVETAQEGLTPQQVQERRDNHRRQIMRDELENTGVKGLIIGAGAVMLPGILALAIFMSTYYPPNQVSKLAIKSAGVSWMLGLLILVGLAYGCAVLLSRSLRRKQATTLALMSYEQLLRHTNKDI